MEIALTHIMTDQVDPPRDREAGGSCIWESSARPDNTISPRFILPGSEQRWLSQGPLYVILNRHLMAAIRDGGVSSYIYTVKPLP